MPLVLAVSTTHRTIAHVAVVLFRQVFHKRDVLALADGV
jgi:hypothetical protein